jgi:serine/threonine protein kinase
VAIKTLHMKFSSEGKRHQRLLREARTVSKLQHPNIISVYEAGEYQEKPYLVFEYVEGISLRDFLKKEGPLVVHRAIRLINQMLDGIAYAHGQGIVHRDLSPSNVLIGKGGTPRIMDFGISLLLGSENDREWELSGTPCYMSPEHFSEKPIGPQSDIFSLGLIFYEMLSGRPAVQAENHFAVMYKIANEPIEPLSLKDQAVDKKLEQILFKALDRDPQSRYAEALEMKKDLDDYVSLDQADETQVSDSLKAHSTLNFLMLRIRHKTDFPSFSQHIMEINQKASVSRANLASASELANAILKDYSLTSKLLKLVNSAFYGQFAGAVTTVSRAVVVLGFEQVRMAASSLLLFEHLQNKSQRSELQDAAISSFMSGIIAKDIAQSLSFKETEEAFICSMLHNLGRHLILFYFPEEYGQISSLMAQKGLDENTATRIVLGISQEDLATGIAKSWKFPDKIVRSMRSLPKGKQEKPRSEEDLLWKLSGFSNELCSLASNPENGNREKALASLMQRFGESFPVSKEQISRVLHSAYEKIGNYSDTLNINLKKSPFMASIASYFKGEEQEVQAGETSPALVQQSNDAEAATYDSLDLSRSSKVSEDPKESHSILINGIQEITNTLLEDYELNHALTMILETIYRGFRFNRVLLCIREASRPSMRARFGFGKNIENIVEKFAFRVGGTADLFNVALTEAKDFGVDSAGDARIKRVIPQWYIQTVSAPAFALYPIIINKVAAGLVYADRDRAGRVLSGSDLNYMKTLCNQIVLAIKQKKGF